MAYAAFSRELRSTDGIRLRRAGSARRLILVRPQLNFTRGRDHTRRIFSVLALGFTIGAGYHLFAVISPGFDLSGSPLRHLLFVGIDLLTAWYMLRRPLWLLPAFLLLVGQQSRAHGGRLWRWWQEGRGVDWRSVLVVSVLALAVALVLWDASMRLRSRRFTPPPAPPAA